SGGAPVADPRQQQSGAARGAAVAAADGARGGSVRGDVQPERRDSAADRLEPGFPQELRGHSQLDEQSEDATGRHSAHAAAAERTGSEVTDAQQEHSGDAANNGLQADAAKKRGTRGAWQAVRNAKPMAMACKKGAISEALTQVA